MVGDIFFSNYWPPHSKWLAGAHGYVVNSLLLTLSFNYYTSRLNSNSKIYEKQREKINAAFKSKLYIFGPFYAGSYNAKGLKIKPIRAGVRRANQTLKFIIE